MHSLCYSAALCLGQQPCRAPSLSFPLVPLLTRCAPGQSYNPPQPSAVKCSRLPSTVRSILCQPSVCATPSRHWTFNLRCNPNARTTRTRVRLCVQVYRLYIKGVRVLYIKCVESAWPCVGSAAQGQDTANAKER